MTQYKIGPTDPREIDKMPSIFIAIPNMGHIQTDLMLRTIQWIYSAKVILFPPQNFSPISVARNKCVEEFLAQDFDYLFFIDSDTVPPPDALKKMLEAAKPFVTGVTCNLKKCEDGMLRPAPMVFRYNNGTDYEDGYKPVLKREGLEEIDACGMSCALIHKSVFKDMEAPYFNERFVAEKGEKPKGEDFLFCEKMRELNIPMWCDFSIHCAHHKTVKIEYPNQVEVNPTDSLTNETISPEND
jgi:glycosyltransferase involved in cell wall biosynthesis